MSQSPKPEYRLSGQGPWSHSLEEVNALIPTRLLSPTTVELLQSLVELYPALTADELTATGLLLEAPRDGHTCLDAQAFQRRILRAQSEENAPDAQHNAQRLIAALEQSELCASWAPKEQERPPLRPIIRAFDRFYAHRYAHVEMRIANALAERASLQREPTPLLPTLIRALPAMEPEQASAVERTLGGYFTLLTGGPGTGKTWTVRNILAVEIAAALREGRDLPKIALAAPTGKAAARMVESLSAGLDSYLEEYGTQLVDGNTEHLAILRDQLESPDARTLHRLLGLGGPTARRNPNHVVQADFVVIDEVSMVDAVLLATLLDGLADHCTLILIGDPNQLASVDAGSALADLVELAQRSPVLQQRLVELKISRRFTADSPVGKMAHAALHADTHDPIWKDYLTPLAKDPALPSKLVQTFVKNYQPLLEAAHAAHGLQPPSKDEWDQRAREAMQALSEFQVLTSHRAGPRSVAALNAAIQQYAIRQGFMRTTSDGSLPVGTPVLILRNDYSLDRFNGDIGVVIVGEHVSFLEPDGSITHIPAGRLPEHMAAFAITVHKSQGSEWRNVAFLLPQQPSQLLTRELVYTAISRAKNNLYIYGAESILHTSIKQRAERATGLVDVTLARLERQR